MVKHCYRPFTALIIAQVSDAIYLDELEAKKEKKCINLKEKLLMI